MSFTMRRIRAMRRGIEVSGISAFCFALSLTPLLVPDSTYHRYVIDASLVADPNCSRGASPCLSGVELVAATVAVATTFFAFLAALLLIRLCNQSHNTLIIHPAQQTAGWLIVFTTAQFGSWYASDFDWPVYLVPFLVVLVLINGVDVFHKTTRRSPRTGGASVRRTKPGISHITALAGLLLGCAGAGGLAVSRDMDEFSVAFTTLLAANFGIWTFSQLFLKTRLYSPATIAGWVFHTLALMTGILLLYHPPTLELTILVSVLSTILGSAWLQLTCKAPLTPKHNQLSTTDCESLQKELLKAKAASRADLNSLKDQTELSIQKQREFLATMSHELRTPLSCIVGLARLWGGGTETSKEAQQDMGTIERMAVQLLRIVDDGLAYVAEDSTSTQLSEDTVQINYLIADLCAMAKWLSTQNNNNFSVKCSPEVPAQLIFDEKRTRQILINFLSNAARFCSDGEITLGVKIKQSGERHFLNWVIRDSGRGMSGDEQIRYLAPFTKSRDSKGLGLGLTISHHLIRELGGRIEIKSKPEVGTAVAILIPVKLLHFSDIPNADKRPKSASAQRMEFQASTPMSLLPEKAYEGLEFAALRNFIKFGQITEIGEWLSKAEVHPENPLATELIFQLGRAYKRIDLEGMLRLIDKADTPPYI